MTFGNTFRALRARFGWSRRQMAVALGISRGQVAMLERGLLMPTPQQQARIAQLIKAGPPPASSAEPAP